MKFPVSGIPTFTLALVLVCATASRGATVVDWFDLAAGGSSTSFSLTADGGLPAATGALAIQSGKGISFPGFPSARTFNSGFWSGDTGFRDSLTGTDRVAAFDIRVAPQGGAAAYSLTFSIPAGREIVIAVGGLYRGPSGATQSIVATSSGGVVSFVQTLAWNGSDVFDQEIEWNAATATLATTLGSDGDSGIAFFRIGPLAGANPSLTFTVPMGYAAGTGDSISIGLGAVVPEPSALTLAGLGAALVLARRRR